MNQSAEPVTIDQSRIKPSEKSGERSRVAPASGHPRPKPASTITSNQSRFTAPDESGVRSFAASVSGHPRSKPASRPPQ